MKIYLLLFILVNFNYSFSQDNACTFKVFEKHPEIKFSDFTTETVGENPYIQEENWNKEQFNQIYDVYSVFCEEMFETAKKEIYTAFEVEPELSSYTKIGNSEEYEIWDIVLKSKEKTYYIHFQFRLSKE